MVRLGSFCATVLLCSSWTCSFCSSAQLQSSWCASAFTVGCRVKSGIAMVYEARRSGRGCGQRASKASRGVSLAVSVHWREQEKEDTVGSTCGRQEVCFCSGFVLRGCFETESGEFRVGDNRTSFSCCARGPSPHQFLRPFSLGQVQREQLMRYKSLADSTVAGVDVFVIRGWRCCCGSASVRNGPTSSKIGLSKHKQKPTRNKSNRR